MDSIRSIQSWDTAISFSFNELIAWCCIGFTRTLHTEHIGYCCFWLYIHVSIVFHKVFDVFHRIFQFFRKKLVQGIFDFINRIVRCQDILREKILGKKEFVRGRRKTLLFLLKRRKKLYFWSFCCLWYFCNKWRCLLACWWCIAQILVPMIFFDVKFCRELWYF